MEKSSRSSCLYSPFIPSGIYWPPGFWKHPQQRIPLLYSCDRGLLVDSGIVVVGSIDTRLLAFGDNKKQHAPSKSMRGCLSQERLRPLWDSFPSSSFPVSLVNSLRLFRSRLFSALLASIFVALGFVPLLAIFFVKDTHSVAQDRQEKYNQIAKTWYEGYLTVMLNAKKSQNKFFITLAVLFVIAIALPSTGLLKSIFFPAADSDYVYVQIEKPQGSDLASTDLSVREVEELLYTNPNVASFVSEVGAGSSFAAGLARALQVVATLVHHGEPSKAPQTNKRRFCD